MTDVPAHGDHRTHAEASLSVAPPRASHGPIGHVSTIGMLLPVRIFLAAGWLRSGAEKLIEPEWWHGTELRDFLHAQHDHALPFFRPVMDHLIAPAAVGVALVVLIAQLLCGLMIVSGKGLRLAVRCGLIMNVVFILAGRVNPSVFYIVLELVLLLAIADDVLGVRASTPSRRTLVASALAGVVALALVPYIGTIEPAHVIDDPAIILVFLATIVGVTLLVRHATHPAHHETRLARRLAPRVSAWAYARPMVTSRQAVVGVAPLPANFVRESEIRETAPWPPPRVEREPEVARPFGRAKSTSMAG
jgi:thiosulfate dehydrogenase [quinone] large subunit